MPRIKVARSLIYLFVASCVSFVLFNILDVTKEKQSKSSEFTTNTKEAANYAATTSSKLINRSDRYIDLRQVKARPEVAERLWATISGRPWFMSEGTIRPDNRSFPYHELPVWPDEVADDDRIANQLMYVPPNYEHNRLHGKKLKKILLWFGRGGWSPRDLPMGQTKFLLDKCPVNTCELSMDMNDAETADAIFFKDRFQMPRHRRSPKQIWIIFLLECPPHTQSFRHLYHVFNWTATYRHDSDIVAPYEKFFTFPSPESQKSSSVARHELLSKKTKKVAWFVSNCGAKNKRLEYALELGEHIEVDIYGGCGKKRCPRSRAKQCFELLDKDYKYYLAFENSNCKDYITEKFYVNGLMHDILPIVMGARPADYERNAPHGSYLHVDDFASPKDLAAHLHALDKNMSLYSQHFEWKNNGQFGNTYFWCRLCAMLHSPRAERESHSYEDLHSWWGGAGVCDNRGWNYARNKKRPSG